MPIGVEVGETAHMYREAAQVFGETRQMIGKRLHTCAERRAGVRGDETHVPRD